MIELAVVEGERKLAEQEALLVSLKKQDGDVSQAELALEMMEKPSSAMSKIANACFLCCSLKSGHWPLALRRLASAQCALSIRNG
jgi:hypothetical protein